MWLRKLDIASSFLFAKINKKLIEILRITFYDELTKRNEKDFIL